MALSFVTWFFGLEISVNLQISLQILWKLIFTGATVLSVIWKMEEDMEDGRR